MSKKPLTLSVLSTFYARLCKEGSCPSKEKIKIIDINQALSPDRAPMHFGLPVQQDDHTSSKADDEAPDDSPSDAPDQRPDIY